jgi:hypothetical protein
MVRAVNGKGRCIMLEVMQVVKNSVVTRETKTGFSIVRPKMSDCNKEAKTVLADKTPSEQKKYAQKLYKEQLKEYKSVIRQTVTAAKESGFEESGLAFSETQTGYSLRPTYKLEKPKAEKASTLRKTDKTLLDSMLQTGAIDDLSVYAGTIANLRGISVESIQDAVNEYISK